MNGTSPGSDGGPVWPAVVIAVALGLVAAVAAARLRTPPAVAAVLGCVTLLAGLGLSLPLSVEADAHHERWLEVYAVDHSVGFVLLADIGLTVALLVAVAAESTSWARTLAWPFAAATLLVGAVAYGGVRGAFLHPATGLQLGAAALVVEALLRLGTLTALAHTHRIPTALPAASATSPPA
ncbi:hypothetical protein [Streptomyces griseosporeus]|uniref:hypothetical protein n=1 Tax=Streptomyces griseosporeus TaxID=1910 RepID=UPI0037900CC0